MDDHLNEQQTMNREQSNQTGTSVNVPPHSNSSFYGDQTMNTAGTSRPQLYPLYVDTEGASASNSIDQTNLQTGVVLSEQANSNGLRTRVLFSPLLTDLADLSPQNLNSFLPFASLPRAPYTQNNQYLQSGSLQTAGMNIPNNAQLTNQNQHCVQIPTKMKKAKTHLQDLQEQLERQAQTTGQLNQAIAHQNETIVQLNQTIAQLRQQNPQPDQTIAHQNETIVQLNQTIAQLRQQNPQPDQTIAHQNETIVQLNETIAQLNQTIAQLTQTIAQLEQT